MRFWFCSSSFWSFCLLLIPSKARFIVPDRLVLSMVSSSGATFRKSTGLSLSTAATYVWYVCNPCAKHSFKTWQCKTSLLLMSLIMAWFISFCFFMSESYSTEQVSSSSSMSRDLEGSPVLSVSESQAFILLNLNRLVPKLS